MTKDERQALREKHYSSESFECCTPECMADDCLSNYPCDVIKVLDATENLKFNDLKVKVECDHWVTVKATKKDTAMTEQNSNETITELPNCDHWVTVKRSGQYGYASSVPPEYWTHTFCPKCGEKL